jgi:hypothetical protein
MLKTHVDIFPMNFSHPIVIENYYLQNEMFIEIYLTIYISKSLNATTNLYTDSFDNPKSSTVSSLKGLGVTFGTLRLKIGYCRFNLFEHCLIFLT